MRKFLLFFSLPFLWELDEKVTGRDGKRGKNGKFTRFISSKKIRRRRKIGGCRPKKYKLLLLVSVIIRNKPKRDEEVLLFSGQKFHFK